MILVNPVSDGNLQVQFNSAATAVIYNARGQVFSRQQVNTGSQTINVQQLPKGIYLLQAGNETKKFIIE